MGERGRPRAFDRGAALQRAMELFWEHGYEGTSISDLTRAMGINAPSLYGAFGSKEALFREAVALYASTAGSMTDVALREEPTARRAVEAMLRGNADLHARSDQPSGCMFVLAAASCSEKNGDVRDYMVEQRRNTIAAIEDRLARAAAAGELPADTDAGAIAAFYGSILHGIAIEARDAVPAEKLHSIVDSAMRAWDALVSTHDPAGGERTGSTVGS